MRRFFSVCLLALTPILHAGAAPPCNGKAASTEQSWNPPNAVKSTALNRFYEIDEELSKALRGQDMEQARRLAVEYLGLADSFRCNWNYGNAIHDANSALGLVALSSGNNKAAVEYLLQSSKSPGSPQLDSFGPTMRLADALVEAGEREAVISYLRGVQKFWRMDDGEIDRWVQQLKDGDRPNFEMQLL